MYRIALAYLTELSDADRGHDNLRLAIRGDLSVAANKGKTGDRLSFVVSGPTTWKTLSLSTCEQYLSLGQFHSHLKMELFNRVYYIA